MTRHAARGPRRPTLPERDKPWLIRTYSGHSTAAKSNELYRKNLAKGQTGLSIAFDLPTQTGYDADHELARGEVGKVGVPVSHLGDMRTLLRGHPARRDEHVHDDQRHGGVAAGALRRRRRRAGHGSHQAHRHHPERHHQGISLARHLRVPAAAVAAADQGHDPLHLQRDAEVESDQRVLLSPAGGGRDAGAGAGIRAGHRAGRARCGEGRPARWRRRTSAPWSGASRSSSMPVSGSSPRSARCARSASCGTRSTAERYGVTDPKHRLFRYGVQVNSLGLTEPQPENNVYRILLEMLAVTLSRDARARAVQLPAWNEALGLPRPWDQQWSIRMQQILAYETDLLDYPDIFEGSKAIAEQGRRAQGRREGGAGAHRGHGRGRRCHRRHEERAGREQHRAPAPHRVRRAGGRRRQSLDRDRAVAALGGAQPQSLPSTSRSRRSRSSACRLGARIAMAMPSRRPSPNWSARRRKAATSWSRRLRARRPG